MEALKKLRSPLRSAFTRLANALEKLLKSTTLDYSSIEVTMAQLDEKWADLCPKEKEILEKLANDSNCTSEDYDKEYEAFSIYEERYTELKVLVNRKVRTQNVNMSDSSVVSTIVSEPTTKRNFKLPKIEFTPYGGEITGWLAFWSQFEKIHLDSDIADEDKYQYLIQATVKNSRIREIIESFPATADHYKEAINCIKSRFGRKDLLIEVYIRDLLSLVLSNASGQGTKMPLFKLYDKIETYLRSLNVLGVTRENYSAILYPLVESCLPLEILRVWERSLNSLTLGLNSTEGENKLECLLKFLRSEVEGEEKVKLARSGFTPEAKRTPPQQVRGFPYRKEKDFPAAASLFGNADVTRKSESCLFCSKSHVSSECKYAMDKLSLDDKRQILVRRGVCFRCVRGSHLSRFCRAKINCKTCGSSDHLHIMCNDFVQGKKHDKPESENSGKDEEDSVLANNTAAPRVLLQTLVAHIRSHKTDKIKQIRCIIDSGSSRSYISEFAASFMQYESIGQEKLVHNLFGGLKKEENHEHYMIRLGDLSNKHRVCFKVLGQKKICSEVPQIPYGSLTDEIKKSKIFLSDMMNRENDLLYEFSPDEIHVLIGADVAGKLFTGNMKHLESGLVCLETRLGWVLFGKTTELGKSDSTNSVLSLHVMEAKISDLWRLDTLGILDPGEKGNREQIERDADEYFRHTLKRDQEGRYIVSLPWVQGHPILPSGKAVAERRLKSCVNSLKVSGILETYQNVFDEWEAEGVIETVGKSPEGESEHFLPHRAVIKENSTTKVRPVFDGSAREKNSASINDCLEKGPNIVELIPTLINRFRSGKIGVIADIKRAFLQIGLNERDRQFLRFLWWEHGDSNRPKVFQHRRVVFGLSCSPYLLGATIQYHLRNVPEEFKETASKLAESFYVDNCVTSLDDAEGLRKFIEESKLILSSAKFDLRGWEHSCEENGESVERRKVPVLGLSWDLQKDCLSVDIRDNWESGTLLTKRNILSVVHQIFDPIGFSCPVTLEPKIWLQECWKLNITWDAELPTTISKKFEKWKKGLGRLKELQIPRWILTNSAQPDQLTLHVFCDASQKAYATCIFLRCQSSGSTSCQLVQARSRVAPIKTVSIPRLELLACLIGARLARSVKADLRLNNIPTFYWSDSSNALYWIKKNENWAPFVHNRVKEIWESSNPAEWFHISGSLNAADLPSRGCSADALCQSRWWEGPPWLLRSPENWPKSEALPDFEVVNAEKRKSIVSAINVGDSASRIYEKFSSFRKNIRMVAWIYRFVNNAKPGSTLKTSGSLTYEELNRAETGLLKLVQRESFEGVEDKRLKTLQCFADQNGLIRVKTRILMREDTRDFRFPIVLPSHHSIVERLIRERHLSLGHAGVQTIMCHLREEFWILKYRKTVRSVISKCVRCKRFDAKPKLNPEAPLPEDRVKEAAVFEVVGIDYAGPLFLRGGNKTWIVIFTCAIYRAVHLEVATSLSTDNFLQALRRFIARRGRPSVIYSDNGCNFTGAENALKNIDWTLISQCSDVQKIRWKFIPPASPWWGGWWERLIGLLKGMLRKILGKSSLNFEELITLICDVENIVNNRPLTYVSDDVADLSPLTPALFLQDLKESGIPDLDFLDTSALNKRHAYRQRVKQDLRKRFRSEYLGHLRQYSTKSKSPDIFQLGDVVLVASDNTKRAEWPLAKIIELYPSKDGHTRLAKITMRNGEFLRPTRRLIPLEVNCASPTEMNFSLQTELIKTRYGRVVKPRTLV